MTTEREELAWAAGFIDGEGSFWVRREGYRDVPAFAANQVDRYVLDRLVLAVGLGKVYGPYGPYGGRKRNAIYNYHVRHREVRDLAERVWPWLSPVKQKQAERVLAVIPSVGQIGKESQENQPRRPWTPYKAMEEAGIIHWDGDGWIETATGGPLVLPGG